MRMYRRITARPLLSARPRAASTLLDAMGLLPSRSTLWQSDPLSAAQQLHTTSPIVAVVPWPPEPAVDQGISEDEASGPVPTWSETGISPRDAAATMGGPGEGPEGVQTEREFHPGSSGAIAPDAVADTSLPASRHDLKVITSAATLRGDGVPASPPQ